MCRLFRKTNRTNVYIDGFNFYYGAVKDTPYKWLDLLSLCNKLCPSKTIQKIKYFTARVKTTRHDPSAPTRQYYYWRALGTIPNLEIIKGNFVCWPRCMPQYPLAYVNDNYRRPPNNVQVERTEEKGSDVNLAACLLFDCFTGDFNDAIVISNDSDLVLPIEMVTRKLGKEVIIVNPNRTDRVRKDPLKYKLHGKLKRAATNSIASINMKLLASSQFPDSITDAKGEFHKPDRWLRRVG